MNQRRTYWGIVAFVIAALAVISFRIYHPGELVEFSDTIYPIRPDLTIAQWSSWWTTTVYLGFVWVTTALLPYVAIPAAARALHVEPGLGQAFQYFVILAIPTIAVANCIGGLAGDKLKWPAALPLLLLPFNIYVALVWPSFIAGYAFGSAALLAWSLVEGIERKRWPSGLLVGALGCIWLSTDSANPPYFLIVVAHTAIFALWLTLRRKDAPQRALGFCGALLVVALLVSARWIVPFVVSYAHYPVAKFATAATDQFGFVAARAHLINALRLTPMWYWGSGPEFSYYAYAYEKNPVLILGTFVPYFILLAGTAVAVRLGRRSLIALAAIAFGWMFLVKGENIPFVAFSHFIYHLPLMPLFRDTEKFVGPFLIDATVVAGVAFASVDMAAGIAGILCAVTAVGAIGGSWLMITGELFTAPHGMAPQYVRVPEPYFHLDDGMRSLAVHRTAISPPDTYYEIGTNWGFFGFDAQFFNDLPNVPLFYPVPISYTQHPYFDRLWGTYWDAASGDDVARTSLETRLSIDGAVVRDDFTPYIGIERWNWRDGDLREAFPRKDSSPELTIYGKTQPAPYAYEVPLALRSGGANYEADFRDLLELGLSTPPLVEDDSTGSAPSRAIPVEHVGQDVPASALLMHAGERGPFVTEAGRYDVVVRAARSGIERRDLAIATRAPRVEKTENVFGVESAFIKTPSEADPIGETYGFETEGAYPAAVTLLLPTLGPHVATCAGVTLDGAAIGNVGIRPGRQTVRLGAIVPPGKFDVRLDFGTPGACVQSADQSEPLWTTSAAPPAIVGVTRPNAPSAKALLRSYDLSMPLSEYPSVHFRRREKVPDSYSGDAFALAHVRGAGCDVIVAVRDAQNVASALDDVARRPLLSQACRSATPEQLTVTTVDVVAIAKPGTLRAPDVALILPQRPARNWKVFRVNRYDRLAGGVRAWNFGNIGLPVAREPVVKIAAAQSCFPWLQMRVELANAPMSRVDVRSLADYSVAPYAAADGHAVVPMEDFAERMAIPDRAELVSATVYSIAPPALADACDIAEAAVSSDIDPGTRALVTIDGEPLGVPRDDRPHRLSLALRAGRHEIELGSATEVGGFFRSGIIAPWRALPADMRSIDLNVTEPGWVIYSQAADSLWHGSLASAPLTQYRADLDLQAYEVDAPGRLHVFFPIEDLRLFAEIVSWGTLLFLAFWAGIRWRRA